MGKETAGTFVRKLGAVVCVGALLASGGCARETEGERELAAYRVAITAVAEEFLDALEAGDGPTAMSLAMVADDAVVCQEAVDHYDQVRDRPRDAKVVEAMVGLDAKPAIAEVTYRQGVGDRELSARLYLEARDGGFAVDLTQLSFGALPVGVGIEVPAEPDVGVGHFRMLSFAIDGECEITGTKAYYTVLPGTYRITVEDPGGLAVPEAFLVTAGIRGSLFTGLKPESQSASGSLTRGVLGEVRSAFAALVYQCAKSRLTGPTCPASVRDKADRVPESGDELKAPYEPTLDVLAQDFDGNWRMTSNEVEFWYDSDPRTEPARGVYSGTVRRDAAGAVVIDLDE
ncbi:MAG: hypothetical protein LBT54_02385 [Bifidobacteriaceae bacterium]|jgi:hypothetical protein|nr:hypothetical protein [Bifidobacteriaceae bacterium]